MIDILHLLAVRRGTHTGHIDGPTGFDGKSSVPINHDSGEVQAAITKHEVQAPAREASQISPTTYAGFDEHLGAREGPRTPRDSGCS